MNIKALKLEDLLSYDDSMQIFEGDFVSQVIGNFPLIVEILNVECI